MKAIVLGAALVAASTTAAWGSVDNVHMADVQALAKSKSWVELLAKAHNVPASERDASWQSLVTEAAIAHATDASITDEQAAADDESELQLYPHLAQSRPFMDARGKRAMTWFKACFRQSYTIDDCDKLAKAFASADPNNSALARELGDLVMASTTAKGLAVRYYAQALTAAQHQKNDKAVKDICGTSDLADALANAMTFEDATAVAQANTVAFDICWPQLNHDDFAKNATASDAAMKNACKGLIAKKALSGVREKKCKTAVGQ
jgi:hypothetical protein